MSKETDYVRMVSLNVSRIKSHYSEWARRNGINYHKLMVIYIIYESEICTQKQIMDIYGIAKQTINNIINSLVKDGLVTLISSEKYHKEKLIEYTEKGLEYAENLLSPLLNAEDLVAEEMGEGKMKALAELFGVFEKIMKEKMCGG